MKESDIGAVCTLPDGRVRIPIPDNLFVASADAVAFTQRQLAEMP